MQSLYAHCIGAFILFLVSIPSLLFYLKGFETYTETALFKGYSLEMINDATFGKTFGKVLHRCGRNHEDYLVVLLPTLLEVKSLI